MGDLAFPALHAGDEVTVIAQAKRPQLFRDEGAFDRRAYLASQGIDLVAALRSPDLIQRIAAATPSAGTLLARTRRRLRNEVDPLFAGRPEVAAVLLAILLGDRSFVEREEAVDFQKTGVFHVLVVAGLHVGALAAVRPRLAIISVGDDNSYGHPNAELLERLANANVRVLRTDRDGAVHILMNGNGLKVTRFVPCLPVHTGGLERAQAPTHDKNQQQQ